jgi:DNA-binding LacI/PurR family transcriptional regulator
MLDRETLERTAVGRTARRADRQRVLRALEEFCASLQPGDRIPTHTTLMRQFDASERTVQAALEILQVQGRIVRKNGVGTFVAQPDVVSVGKTDRTLVVVARPDHSFFDRFLDLLFRYAEAGDLNLICQPVEAMDSRSLLLANTLHPLGFLLFGYPLAPLALQLQQHGNRVVLIGAPPADVTPEVPCIYNDHEHGGYLTTMHLIELGHRRLAYAQVGMTDLLQNRRWRGHQRALGEARRMGFALETTLVSQEQTESWETRPEQAAEYFARLDAPTALVAWNDHEALRLLSTLTRAGISVPAQVSLVGYDALPKGKVSHPPLTTVDHGMRQQLVAAIDLLTRSEPVPAAHSLVFMPTLILGQSAAPPRQEELR